jgi:hypothetical protein
MPSPVLSALDTLSESLLSIQNDNLMRVIRSRDQVLTMLNQLSMVTNIITTMANILSIEIDNKVVEPTERFDKWSINRLRILAVHCISFAEKLPQIESRANLEITEARLAKEKHEAEAAKATAKIEAEKLLVEGKISALEASVRSLQKILSGYVDQDEYVVAEIDVLTKKPTKYYVEYEDAYDTTAKLGEADYRNLKGAKNLRSAVVRSLRSKADKVDWKKKSKSVAVFQVSLYRIELDTYEDKGE